MLSFTFLSHLNQAKEYISNVRMVKNNRYIMRASSKPAQELRNELQLELPVRLPENQNSIL